MILKVTALCVAAAMICAALRPVRPEMATAVALAGGVAALMLAVSEAEGARTWIDDFRRLMGDNRDVSGVVLKGAGIAIVSEMGAQLCSDAGESALAGRITLAGRVATLGLCAPLARELTNAVAATLR